MSQRDVDTPRGPGRLTVSPSSAARAVLLLGHGAGGGIDAPDLEGLAQLLPARGITVVRHEQPWRVAGRKVAGNPASLDEGWVPAVTAVAEEFTGLPLFVGGRSAGARVACRSFAEPALGLVCLSFPLHPPGKPLSSRIDELAAPNAPRLVVQGLNDPFGSPEEVEAALAANPSERPARHDAGTVAPWPATVHVMGVQGSHSFEAPKRAELSTEQVQQQIAETVASFIEAHLHG